MKKYGLYLIIILMKVGLASCSTTKNTTDLNATVSNLKGNWILTNIDANMPDDFTVTRLFDQAPPSAFENSKWNLIRNGKGSYTLEDGHTESINWSIYGEGDGAELQFKKLNGENAREVDKGYRLQLNEISSDSFKATEILPAGSGKTGTVTFTYTRAEE